MKHILLRMENYRPQLLATMTKSGSTEVRHLIVEHLDGFAETRLVEMSAGNERVIGHGTLSDVKALGRTHTQKLLINEGFNMPSESDVVFEPLEHIVPLLLKLGFSVIYDPGAKKIDGYPLNLTGVVSLGEWRGLKANAGGRYLYALNGRTIIGKPSFPENVKTPVDFSDYEKVRDIMTAVAAIGRTQTLVLG